MAPQTNEYWTKVALLGGLAVVCAVRPLLDRMRSSTGAVADRPRRQRHVVVQAGALAAGAGLVAATIIAAGAPARDAVATDVADVSDRVLADIDPATFPAITVEQDVVDWNHEIDGAGAREIVLTLVENLQLENDALLGDDPSMLAAVDHGDRLDEMRARLEAARSTGTIVVEHYQFDDVHVTLLVPFGEQSGLSLGLETTGTRIEETYDAEGRLERRESAPFATTFAMRRATGGRWLNVGTPVTGT
jgi:hypothetical protein